MNQRIVITGMGAVTPIGTGVRTYWENLIAGKSGIGPVSRFDTSAMPVKLAAEVRDFHPEMHMSRRLANDSALFSRFAYAAAAEAIAQSGIAGSGGAVRTGIVMGTAMSGVAETAAEQTECCRSGATRVSPRFVPKILGNIAAAQIAIEYGFGGPSFTVSTACASGGDAIKLASMLLHAGEADVMLAVGGESILCPIVTSSLSMAKALSRAEDPALACCPFDTKRNGFVMGEGGGALVLETEEHARRRGAKPYGVILAAASNNDAYHVTSPAPDGHGAVACMQDALRISGLSPAGVGYINAHGTSTPVGDGVEIAAIQRVFSGCRPAVSSTKAATGHMMGAGGITEVIACVMACRENLLPATLHLTDPDAVCAGTDLIAGSARSCRVEAAMSNAFGFGGQNSCVIVSGY